MLFFTSYTVLFDSTNTVRDVIFYGWSVGVLCLEKHPAEHQARARRQGTIDLINTVQHTMFHDSCVPYGVADGQHP
jgi:hypothetical protein